MRVLRVLKNPLVTYFIGTFSCENLTDQEIFQHSLLDILCNV